MAMSERSRHVLYTALCKVVDEAAVEEFLSCFPVRDDESPAWIGGAERWTRIEARLTQLEARIGILATDTRDRLTRIEQLLSEASTSRRAE